MQFHFHANQSHCHNNGFTLRLALKQRELGNGLLGMLGAIFAKVPAVTLNVTVT